MSEAELPELVDEVVVRPGEAHELPPASAAEHVSVNERRVHQVVAMGGGDWAEVTARAAAEGQDDVMIINMGPQHPSTHGVLRLVVELKGEEVINLQPVVGYLHTGIEKSAEFRTWVQGVTFVTRMDYLAPIFNETAYCLAVEKLLGIEPPPRATALRVLMMELNRICSHLVWLATTGLELGALSIMLYGFREREEILDILEDVTGLRMNHAWVRPAGVSQDLPDGTEDKIRAFVRDMRAKADEYETLLTNNPIWLERTRGIGHLSLDELIGLGTTGPMLRAAGLDHDLRKVRALLRLRAVRVHRAHGHRLGRVRPLPGPAGRDAREPADRRAGPRHPARRAGHVRPTPRSAGRPSSPSAPTGWATPRPTSSTSWASPWKPSSTTSSRSPRASRCRGARSTCPSSRRGASSATTSISDGGNLPYRVHVRDPSFVNLQTGTPMAIGLLVADVIAAMSSIDPVLGGVDR